MVIYRRPGIQNLTDTLDADKVMGEDSLVIGTDISAGEESTVTDYFAAVRLSRQQARDSALTLIQEAMSYSEDPDALQNNEQIGQIVQTALTEAQIESLVIAKGYAECVAYISDGGISVAVATPEGGLQQSDVAVIADIILTQSEFTMEQIRVVEVQ